MAKETIDVTLPGRKVKHGTRHIVTQIMEEIEDIFVGMGYQIVEGYEVESDHYNFERMNLPKDHPARDMQDTFYISDEILIRHILHQSKHGQWKNMISLRVLYE